MGIMPAAPPEDDLERWITDLGRSETTVSELRERLSAGRDSAAGEGCPTCSGASARPDDLATMRSA